MKSKMIAGLLVAFVMLGAAARLAAQGELEGDASARDWQVMFLAHRLETEADFGNSDEFRQLPADIQREALAVVRVDKREMERGANKAKTQGAVARLTGKRPLVVLLLVCGYVLLGWYRRRFGQRVEIVMDSGPLLREGGRREEHER